MVGGEPEAGWEGGTLSEVLNQVNNEEVIIAAGDNAVDRGVVESFLRKIGDVVADPDLKHVRKTLAEAGSDLPVAFDNGTFGLEEDEIWLGVGEALFPLRVGPFFCNTVQPGDCVPVGGQVAGGVRGHHGIDVRRGRKVLELAVL